MRKPIKKYSLNDDEPSANIVITCSITNISLKWNKAVDAGWTWDYDVNRPTKTQYYSNEKTDS